MDPFATYSQPTSFPQDFEELSTIHPDTKRDRTFKHLVQTIIEWINDELSSHRIIVRDLEKDLYDGQVLQKLYEKLSKEKLDIFEVTLSEAGQKKKLSGVIQAINELQGTSQESQKWSVDSIYSRDVLSTIHLIIALIKHFRAEAVKLPRNVTVKKVVAQKKADGTINHWIDTEILNPVTKELEEKEERDDFDSLFDDEHAEQLQLVKSSLFLFVNKHLKKLNFDVAELETQFHDGVYLIILFGLLEKFFVPLYEYHVTPRNFEQKVHNVGFFFRLLVDVGVDKPKVNAEDIVNKDLKSILRILYLLFVKYK